MSENYAQTVIDQAKESVRFRMTTVNDRLSEIEAERDELRDELATLHRHFDHLSRSIALLETR